MPAEGGAILLVEDAGAAGGRGAPQVYGEIAGYARHPRRPHREDPPPDAG